MDLAWSKFPMAKFSVTNMLPPRVDAALTLVVGLSHNRVEVLQL